MNTLRLRVVKLTNLFGAGSEFPYAVQLTLDSGTWWTLGRFKSEDEALGIGKGLEPFIKQNLSVKEERVVWETKL